MDLDYFVTRSIVNESTGCWIWQKAKRLNGYGHMKYRGGTTTAHRAAYVVKHKLDHLSPNTFVCHSCDEPSCVNPDHLFLGSAKDNYDDCRKKGRAKPPPTKQASPQEREDKISRIRALRVLGYGQRRIARELGISRTGARYWIEVTSKRSVSEDTPKSP
jgi:hypothetical protein